MPAPVAPKSTAAPAVPREASAAPQAAIAPPNTAPACARPRAAPAETAVVPMAETPAATAGAARPPVTASRMPPPAAARATLPRFQVFWFWFCCATMLDVSRASNRAPPTSASHLTTSRGGTPRRAKSSKKAALLRASKAPSPAPRSIASSSRAASQSRGIGGQAWSAAAPAGGPERKSSTLCTGGPGGPSSSAPSSATPSCARASPSRPVRYSTP
mmetsp:Transcript_92583/g.293595  ORF Transcript_92583/g.293595 Transcript_92583/m.293595 type:complete len:216 (-) Transcript_92583:112-759(-)